MSCRRVDEDTNEVIMVQICNHMAHVAICDTSNEQVSPFNLANLIL